MLQMVNYLNKNIVGKILAQNEIGKLTSSTNWKCHYWSHYSTQIFWFTINKLWNSTWYIMGERLCIDRTP